MGCESQHYYGQFTRSFFSGLGLATPGYITIAMSNQRVTFLPRRNPAKIQDLRILVVQEAKLNLSPSLHPILVSAAHYTTVIYQARPGSLLGWA